MLTLAVTTLLVVWAPPTAEAVGFSVTQSALSVVQGNSITLTTTVTIQSNERIPIQSAQLRLFANAALNVEHTIAPYSSPRTMTLIQTDPTSGYYTYGSGYGVDERTSTPYSFGYGYGYGGYSGVVTLTYQCVISTTTQWNTGAYYARADINCSSHTYSSDSIAFSVTAATAPPSGGGGGAVGGGGAPPATTVPPTETTTPAPTEPATPPTPPSPPTEEPEVVIEDITDRITDEGVVTEEVEVTSVDGGTTVVISS